MGVVLLGLGDEADDEGFLLCWWWVGVDTVIGCRVCVTCCWGFGRVIVCCCGCAVAGC